MYFITNETSNVIAASKDFLEKFGSRDICSISMAIKDRQIVINNSQSKITFLTKDENYNFTKSKMFSAFGELYLYQLFVNKKAEINSDDSDIAYLKKIKDGATKKDYNFNIPEINIDKTEIKEDSKPKIIKITEDSIEPEVKDYAHEESNNIAEEVIPETFEKKIEEKIENDNKDTLAGLTFATEDENIVTKTATKLDNNIEATFNDIKDDNLHSTEDLATIIEAEEKKDVVSLITPENDTDTINQIKPETEKLLEELEAINVKSNINKPEKRETEIQIDDIAEIAHNNKNNITSNKKEKRSGLDFIKSKLFPWGSKDKDIEIEEEATISTAKDLAKDTNVNLDKQSNEAKKVVSTVEDNIIVEKTTEEENVKKEINLDTEKELIEIDKPTKNIKNEKELSLEEEELLVLKETTMVNTVNENNTINTQKVNDIAKNNSDDNLKINMDELNNVKTETDDIKTEKKIEEKEKKKTFISKENELLNKLVSLQAESIDFDKNAKNISIDLDNYKLLLNNFTEELNNYKEDIKSGNSAIIDMLTDASTLLSLEPITKKLNSIASNYNKELSIKELYLFNSILQDKLSNKQNKNEVVENITTDVDIIDTKIENKDLATKDLIIDEKELVSRQENNIKETEKTKQIVPPAIPLEAIELNDANTLYSAVKEIETVFDLDKPVNDLSLPKTLVLEFINDFITQSKEHLPILVDSYKNRDIKQIQATAHMLKGAASNLRLDSISKVLFSIQKENNLEKTGNLIKKFVGNLKGLEYQVKNFESNNNEN